MIDLEAIFNPQPLWEAAPVPTTPDASRLDVPAQTQNAPAIGAGLDAQAPAPTAEASKPSEPRPSEATQTPEAPAEPSTVQVEAPAPVESSTVQVEAPLPTENPSAPGPAPKRFDLERIPPQARPLLEEFAQGMGEDLLAVSPVQCSWPDCRFPATVLIKSAQNVQGERVRLLVWGCPRCGREYRPRVLSARQLDRMEAALFGQQWESLEAPETAAAKPPLRR